MAERPPVTGGFGSAPPPGAPHEVAQPLQPDAGGVVLADGTVLTPQALAAANERQLQPLTYGRTAGDAPQAPVAAAGVQGPREVVAAGLPPPQIHTESTPEPAAPALVRAPKRGSSFFGRATAEVRETNRLAAEERDRQRELRKTEKAAVPEVAPAADQTAPAPTADAASATAIQPPRPVIAAGGDGAKLLEVLKDRPAQASRGAQPAASSTDSPSRGIPRAIADPGKQITGGFGDAADAQYFPLDGSELLSVVWVVMDELAQRLQNDLRFSIATVYPRVAVRAQVVVEGYAADQNFTIEKLMPPHDKTPIEVAHRWGDQVVFVVAAERREFNADGTIATPPNAMRQEIGVTPPRKQFVGTGASRQLVDVPPEVMDPL